VTCHSDLLICEVDSTTPQLTKTKFRKPGAGRGGGEKLETRSHCLFSGRGDGEKLETKSHCLFSDSLYINSLRLLVYQSVCDGGFGGWGRERSVKQRVTGVSLWQGLDHHSFRVQTVSTKHCSHPKGRNDGRIASFSHRTRGGYKNLPLPPPPHYRKNRWLYRGACFRKFPKLSGTKVQNVRTGVLGFLTSGKGVNTRIDNLRVHMVDFDTRTTSVGTTARLRWLEWRSHGCPKVTGTTSFF
jgi:hypothetical protein